MRKSLTSLDCLFFSGPRQEATIGLKAVPEEAFRKIAASTGVQTMVNQHLFDTIDESAVTESALES